MLEPLRTTALLASFFLVSVSSPAAPQSSQETARATLRPLKLMTSLDSGAVRLTLDRELFSKPMTSGETLQVSIPRGDGTDFNLELQPFTVTTPQSRFFEVGPGGQTSMAAPSLLAFRGKLAGDPGSHAFLSISARGMVNGSFTQADGQRFFLSTQGSTVAAGAGEIILSREQPTPGLLADVTPCGVTAAHDFRPALPSAEGAVARGVEAGRSPRVLFVAIDADQYFYNLFGDTAAAQDYIAQVIAAVSDIYTRDFGVKLVLSFSRVWSAGGEPFTAQDLGGFADYWTFNEDPTPYHLIHLMSGRRDTSYGGIAYVAGSCSGFAYGISAFLLGSFPTPLGNPHLGTWDVVVVAHEMGHNMGTFHTHDGYNPPIDQCGSTGTWARGEIMSYCHILAGGLLNTELRFTSRVQEVVRSDIELNNCQFFDCNNNGIDDALDIANATSQDTNANQIPDECEDCNDNGILDPQDIALGMPDVNANGIPDVCEPDCDNNGIPDSYQIFVLGAADVNLNLIPDQCEPDCDGNKFADFVQIAASGGTLDFDRNGVLDSCQDCNNNSITDWIDLLRPGNIYVADLTDFVREFHGQSAVAMATHGSGTLADPHDVVCGPDRMVYIADRGNNRVMRLDPDSGALSVFVAAGSGGLSAPSGLTFHNGKLYVSSLLGDGVLEFHGQSGAFIRNFVSAGSGGLDAPYGLEFGPNGNLFVAGANRVNEYDGNSGAFLQNFVSPGEGGLSDPRGIAWLPDGRLLVASRGSNQVLAYDAGGNSLGQFNDNYPLGGLWGIRVGPNGNVFVVRVSGGVRVIEYDVATGRYLRSFLRGDAQLAQPTGLAFRQESPVDCNGNGVLDECDIADGLEEDANENNIPDACEPVCEPLAPPLAAPDGINKNRYLTFDLTAASSPVRAIHVTFADLPAPFESFEGQGRWVGPPQDRPDSPSATFAASTLQCDPHYSDWSGLGVLAVYDPAIVPGGRYEVRAIVETCPLNEQLELVPLDVFTVGAWGDVIEPFNPPDPTVQPNASDIAAMVTKFRNDAFALPMARTDLNPDLPDQILDFSDIALVVDAFRGEPYPFAGPTPCP